MMALRAPGASMHLHARPVQARLGLPIPVRTLQRTRLTIRPLAVLPEASPSSSPCLAEQQQPARELQSAQPMWFDKIKERAQQLLQHTAKGAALLGLTAALLLASPGASLAARSAGRVGGFSGGGGSSMGRSFSGGGMSAGSFGGGSGFSGSSRSFGSGSWSSSSAGASSSRARSYRPSTSSTIIVAPSLSSGYAPTYSSGGSTTAAVAGATFPGEAVVVMMSLACMAFVVLPALTTASGGGGGALMAPAQPITLTKVQVGLLSVARELKTDLDRIAAEADTGSSSGLAELMQEAVLALLRNPSYCVYGDAKQVRARSELDVEQEFSAWSIAERGKFEKETLVATGGRRARHAALKATGRLDQVDELIVVTLLVAARGSVRVPERVDSVSSLQALLRSLAGLAPSQVMGVEVLWTPQAAGDYYTRDEAIAEYPTLRQL